MASISGSRSGGKITRQRRSAAAARTPYDRPAPSPAPPSPNWLSRFVLSPTRLVASGAGKLLSAVLDLDASSPASSSSYDSSPSSSATGSGSEKVGDFNDVSDKPFEGNALNEDIQPLGGNKKSKQVIEELLMQESFSREEGDRLIKMIRSRVVDSPASDGDGNKRSKDVPNMSLLTDIDSPELCSAAVLEAKKWLEEKKSGLDSNSDFCHGSQSLDLVKLSQAPRDEGSPVDVAKSYMRTRPPWASPSIDHIKPPMPFGTQLFKEETPHLFSGNSASSSKLKRDSPATGSWSIQDEIRRVRSRATEEMLRTSSKIDWSTFAIEHKNDIHSSVEANSGEKGHNFTSLPYPSSNLTRGLDTQISPDLPSKLEGLHPESVLSDQTNINSEQNQGSGVVQQTKGSQDGCIESLNDTPRDGGLVNTYGIEDTNGDKHQVDLVEETREDINCRLHDGICSVIKEKVGAEAAFANGNSTGPSFHEGQDVEQNTNTNTPDKEPITIDSNPERTDKVILEQENCKVVGESMDVPDVIADDTFASKEDEGVVTCSQNSSSIQNDVQQDNHLPGSEPELVTTPNSISKQKGKRVTTRYNRRGRGRGAK